MAETAASKRYATIDGLRGYAALYVLTFHQLHSFKTGSLWLDRLLEHRFQVLPLFFLVSGYLLYSTLERRSATDPDWRIHFYIERAFRILPLWWALLLIQLIFRGMPFWVFFTNFTFFFSVFTYDTFYLPVVPAWSLVVEEWFYLLLPWVKKYLKQGLDLALMLIGSMLLARVWLVFGGKIGLPTENYFLFRSPVANFNYFFTGIAVAYVLKRIPELKSGEWLRGARGHFFDFLAVITFLGPVLKVFFHTELSCALVLISALSSQGFLSKVFKWKPLCWVGRRCYAVYIAQAFLEDWTLGLKERLGMHFHLSENSLQIFWFPIFLMLVLTFAELSRNYWEQPWQEFGRRFVQRRKIKIADLAVN